MQSQSTQNNIELSENQTRRKRRGSSKAPRHRLLSPQLFGLCIFVPGTPGLTSARLSAYPGVGGEGGRDWSSSDGTLSHRSCLLFIERMGH
jgi:hypothetical protein